MGRAFISYSMEYKRATKKENDQDKNEWDVVSHQEQHCVLTAYTYLLAHTLSSSQLIILFVQMRYVCERVRRLNESFFSSRWSVESLELKAAKSWSVCV